LTRLKPDKIGEVRFLLLSILCAVSLFADTFKLYLKDGGYHAVRDYSIQGDRVHYYSTERGDWEDIPLELVDIEHTEKERKSKDTAAVKEAKEESEEAKALREERKEIASIPADPGAYFKVGNKIDTLVIADYQVVTDKKRKTLQILSPIPLVPGKASVVIKGDHANYIVSETRPNFYLRLDEQKRFGIITLTPRKGQRVVENISVVAVANIAQEQRNQMDTFEQDLGGGLFKVWPEKDLAAGEYALVEFADTGEINDVQLIIWDFAIHPPAGT
jgi:hypothetical protein